MKRKQIMNKSIDSSGILHGPKFDALLGPLDALLSGQKVTKGKQVPPFNKLPAQLLADVPTHKAIDESPQHEFHTRVHIMNTSQMLV